MDDISVEGQGEGSALKTKTTSTAAVPQRFLKTDTVASFILVNGMVIAAIVFIALHFAMTSMRASEARNRTRDILRATEQSLTEMEKTVRTLQYFHASINAATQEQASVLGGVQKLLTGNAPLTSLLWVTDKGIWRQQDIQGMTERTAYNPALGWPAYNDLAREVFRLNYNEIDYLQEMPWPAFAAKAGDTGAQQPVGLISKSRLNDGSTGILLVVTTPAMIFGNSWAAQREDIDRVTIKDRDTSFVLVDTKISSLLATEDNEDASVETVSYVLTLGNQSWDIKFGVRPTLVSKMLITAPWAALAIILILTGIAAGIAHRKHAQDLKFEEMSKNLEGTQSELQSKISERDKLFHALRKSEREYKAVINSVSDVIFETDEIGRIMFLNETWKKMTLRETADTIGESLFAMLEVSEQTKQRDMFDELVRGERQAYRAETRLNLGHGTVKPVEISFSMLRMTEDKSIRVVGSIHDIEKRRRAELAVREAEQRFRAIFENSVSGIYQISADGRFISANMALAEILGYGNPNELMSEVSDIGGQLYVNPNERAEFVQKLLFEGRVSGNEAEVTRRDGKKIWILQNARVVRNEKGSVDYYEGSVWDVTERKEAEEAMRYARIQAEISSRTRMEFLANMSHELRTPLNAVIGFSEIIKDEVMGPIEIKVYKEYAQDIYDSGNYLLKIISEILEVSKIETGNRELNQSNFKLMKAVKACMTIMATRIDQAGVDVKVELPEELPELLAEELGFKQIMLNLIGNAIKFTPQGGKVRVTAGVQPTGQMYIDVADNGIGMSAEEIKKAMTPFGKVDTSFSGMKAGTGLGLTIVDSLVRLHGGEFQLISQKGAGTTARVIMPAGRVLMETVPQKPAAPAEETVPEAKTEPASAADGEAPHLKVVK
ncbi:MAG TPA: PAS domain-containing sensor histidine kinase [Patescibacteria group bacterium]|nr:PAS domain-containing sensor histidine kinase [Patescibacteria group bacterium]